MSAAPAVSALTEPPVYRPVPGASDADTAASDRRWDRSPRVRAPFTQGDGGAFWPRV